MHKIFIGLCCSFIWFTSAAQEKKVIDEVIAIIGNEIILQSDIEAQKLQARQQGIAITKSTTCLIIEQLLMEKLMLNQAKVDSIPVNDQQVQSELDRRIRYFVGQIGSEEKLEEYYNKSIIEIKEEFYELIEDQLRIQGMQAKINEDIGITPGEIESFFNDIPKDSLPYINAKVEMAQIIKKPEISQDEIDKTRARLQDFKKQIENGKSFTSLAVLYSQDPGSATKGGDLGFVSKGTFVPEFDAVAARLEEGQLSEVFSSPFGYHLMQLVERRGEQYRAKHILLKPRIKSDDLIISEAFLDSIRTLILNDTISFEKAAAKYSDDDASKNNGGKIVNQADGSTEFDMQNLDGQLALTVNKLEIGEISEPVIMQTQDGNQAYRIIKLINRTEPHVANLKDDYLLIKKVATNNLQQENLQEWIKTTISSTYIKLNKDFEDCKFENNWIK